MREAELEFASRWAMGWLHGARRLASAASRPAGILLLDSSHGQDAEAVHAQALDLALRRAGFRVLMLSNELGDERLERALRALDPTAIVLCGPGADTPGAIHLVRKIREVGFDAPLFGFRATGLIGDAVPSAGEQPEPGHRDAERRPAPPRRPGLRLSGHAAKKTGTGPLSPVPVCSHGASRRWSSSLQRGRSRFRGVEDDLGQRREVKRCSVFLALRDRVVEELLEEALLGAL